MGTFKNSDIALNQVDSQSGGVIDLESNKSSAEQINNPEQATDELDETKSISMYHRAGEKMCCLDQKCCSKSWWHVKVWGKQWVRPRDLVQSYFFSEKAVFFLRSVITIWCSIILIGAISTSRVPQDLTKYDPYFFFYFTNLSYIGLTTYFWLATINGVRYHLRKGTETLKRPATTFEIVTSLFYTTSFSFHILVPIVYWSLLSQGWNQAPVVAQWLNISRHGMDFVVMFLELFLNKILYQWGHIIVAYLVVLIYIFWAWIGAAIFPTNGPNQDGFPYGFLNYNKGSSFGIIAGLTAAFVVIWFFVLYMHYARTILGKMLSKLKQPRQ